MKKNLFKLSACALAGAALAACCGTGASGPQHVSHEALASGFVTPPDSIQTSVYWYWISNNISKEGVIKDLESMKKAGINRAFIGNIGQDDVPYGNVKMLSEEWWDILHAALKKATELDIEIGIFNSPGWSQSGGPWVKADQAMRYLASSETRAKGPQKFNAKLVQPTDSFQDVRVIAYPVPKDDQLTLNASNGTITSTPKVADLTKITDGDQKSGIAIPKGGEITIDLKANAPFTARSLTVKPTEHPLGAQGELQVKEGDNYRTLSKFDINRTNTALNVGFDQFAPVVVSIPATTGTDFRVIIKGANAGSGLAEVALAAAPRVERFSEKTLAKMHPTPLPYWKDYQWPVQPAVEDAALMVDPAKVQDISQYLAADGTLTWDVPEGEWVILRMGMTPTGTTNSPAAPEATGYETDKMSREHIASHFDAHMGEILRRIPAEDRKTFKVVVQDSYETGGQNFTDGMIEEFKTRYGYDPTPYLPVYNGIVVGSEEASDRFLWDVRRMIADKVAYDYVGGLRDVSHQHGLHTWLENYGHWGFPGEFLMYGGQSDEIGGEFWSEGELGDIENRAASSCGHIYGKTKISAESNTCAGNSYARYPGVIKQRGDRFFAEGINNTLLHVYITQPDDRLPGVNAWFGNEFNRHNTWFSQIDNYLTYLKRANFMLQQGLNVADAAYFIGEDAPKMTGIVDPALPTGYQFDYMNAEVIEKYMDVKDGKITLPHGTQYRILVLPKLETSGTAGQDQRTDRERRRRDGSGPKPLAEPAESAGRRPAGESDGRRNLGRRGRRERQIAQTGQRHDPKRHDDGRSLRHDRLHPRPQHSGRRAGTLRTPHAGQCRNLFRKQPERRNDRRYAGIPRNRYAARTVGPDHRRDTQTARLRAETGRYGRSARNGSVRKHVHRVQGQSGCRFVDRRGSQLPGSGPDRRSERPVDGRFRRQGTRPARTGRIRIADRLVDQRRRQDQILLRYGHL